MQVDDKLISYLEELSCFSLCDSEKTRLANDLQKIINGVSKLLELNTDRMPAEVPYNNVNIFREDEVLPSFDRELILKNAPVKNDEYFIAPKTVE
ncbi:MAG: Asp-tRNA(Asn)/Glu-tRNA(Gln) amidotransferase subunit GatC [Treponema sp.]|nr:Asp-tRNA(Asn)/Glu-tRNA(Gln) amidotransferase subunit GatC [Treponema sp.]